MTDAEFQNWLEESVKGMTSKDLRAEFEALGCEFVQPSLMETLQDYALMGELTKATFNGPCWSVTAGTGCIIPSSVLTGAWSVVIPSEVHGRITMKETETPSGKRQSWSGMDADELALVA